MNQEFETIKIENLAVAYQEIVIFNHFNLTLPSKGCVCFYGPSGCGKTSLLQTIAGLKKPIAGSINTQWTLAKVENSMSKTTKENKVLPKTAYVFQEDRLIPWLTALENVSIVLPKEKSIQQKIETAKKWLMAVGLQDALDKYPAQLSGGMKQRVNIARALAFDAPIVLMDEPFKGLDDAIKGQIIGMLQELKKNKLLLLVTHDKEDASQLADQTIMI